jgi:glutathione synthase/RimK-type ligase-like ATP-grasp enzyme
MEKKRTIAVYIPKWLYRNDVGITMFVRALYKTINESTTYNLLKITPSLCRFKSLEEANAFVEKHNIAFVIYHDTRTLEAAEAHEIGLNYLETLVPFLNPKEVHLADNKFDTKRVLKEKGIPVLPSLTVTNKQELWSGMEVGKLYVIKPSNEHSGVGIKLIKRTHTSLLEFLDRSWEKVDLHDTPKGLRVRGKLTLLIYVLSILCTLSVAFYFMNFLPRISPIVFCICGVVLIKLFEKKINQSFVYRELMLEPFFGDTLDEFYCLRCTVLGDKVVEAAKKANKNNVTPNISHGGKATKIQLSKEQEDMAVSATHAFGAVFSGVDLLFAEGKTVVCEVNVGPIGVYCEQTEVDVGGMLGEYVMQRCDEMSSELS